MTAEDILSKPQPPPDEHVAYGADPNQFLEVRLPPAKGPHPVLLNIHGGFWRAQYGLAHAGHLCQALRVAGVATLNPVLTATAVWMVSTTAEIISSEVTEPVTIRLATMSSHTTAVPASSPASGLTRSVTVT